MLENSWNTSFRIMYNLPYSTHRFFVQPVSGKTHIKRVLLERFLGFLTQIRNSRKKLPSKLFGVVCRDTGSITGSNLRKIMLLQGKHTIEEISVTELSSFEYHPVEPGDQWKIGLVRELLEIREENFVVENLRTDEVEDILEYLCTS